MDVRRRYQGLACVFLLALFVAPLLSSKVAHAADPVEKVTALNKKALDEYKKRDYDSARALLKEALEICNSSGLDTHPIKARTHIHLGIVAIVGFKDHDLGLKHFHKALEIQPDIKLTKTLSNRTLEDAFEEAALAGGGGGGGAEPAGGGGGQQQAQEGDEGGGSNKASENAGGEDEDGERPAPRKRPPPKKKKPVASEDGDSGEEEEGDEGEAPKYRIYLGAMIGVGGGIASGKGELDPTMHQLKSAGAAAAQTFQISPEVGFFIKPTIMIGARLRIQYMGGLTGKMVTTNECGSDHFCTPSPWGLAGFARATIFLGSGSFRWYVAPEIGGGSIRHAVSFDADKTCGTTGHMSTCVDSLASGPLLAGAGFGFLYDFSSAIGVNLNVVADLGVPKFTFNGDLNGGLVAHF